MASRLAQRVAVQRAQIAQDIARRSIEEQQRQGKEERESVEQKKQDADDGCDNRDDSVASSPSPSPSPQFTTTATTASTPRWRLTARPRQSRCLMTSGAHSLMQKRRHAPVRLLEARQSGIDRRRLQGERLWI